MNLGIGLSLGSKGGAASAPVSLFDTSDFTSSGAANHLGIISPSSFRHARTAGGDGRFFLTGLPPSVRITGSIAAWDGADLGALTVQIRINNTTTFAVLFRRDTTLGAFDTGVINTTGGTISFAMSGNGFGCRVDDFFVSAA